MSFFRSEAMDYYQLVIPDINAHEILAALGRLNLIHFIDKNEKIPLIHKPYVNMLRHCSEFENRIEQTEDLLHRFGFKIKRCQNIVYFLNRYQEYLASTGKHAESHFRELESLFDDITHSLIKSMESYDEIQEKL